MTVCLLPYRESMLLFGSTVAFLNYPASNSSLPQRATPPGNFVKPISDN